MKIAVISDIHANLPALQAALESIGREGCDAIFHTGDAIGVGPYPAECLELLLRTPNIHFVKGNHDSYFADGIPDPRPDYMSEGEFEHQQWTRAQLDAGLRQVVAGWPYAMARNFEGAEATFLHYATSATGLDFAPVIRNASPQQLDALFASYPASLIFYGHIHSQRDVQGKARYLNPGSLGCCEQPLARYYTVDFWPAGYIVQHRSVPYDDADLRKAFVERQVPEREFIARVFFGGRF